MKSAASLKGHPIHPMLVVFPIAFWIGALVADLAYVWFGDPFWYQLAWFLIAGGLAGAVAAAIPGAVDYFHSVTPYSGCKPIARRHALLNLALIGLYGLNLWWRTDGAAVAGGRWWTALAASALGNVLLAYSGWLGGHLVYNCEVGRQQTQVGGQPTLYGPSLKGKAGELVEVARTGEIGEGQLKHVRVNGAWVGVAHTHEGYFAFDEICTHKGGPLCDGVLVGTTIQCPWHGSRFDVRTGEVRAGPATARIGTFELLVDGSAIKVRAPRGPEVAARARIA